MNHIMTVHYNNQPIYDIVFEKDFSRLAEEIKKLEIAGRKICIVSDSHVAPLYLDEVQNQFSSSNTVFSYVFEAGEASKNLDTVKSLYKYLIENHFERKDVLVALGGGVVGDLTGYTAATYLRGIDFIQVPTSLLAQVDSSIGGKTGVDFDCYKNMIGAFHMPKLVYINTSTLQSLSKRQYLSGLGEVVKYGIITDSPFFDWLEQHKEEIKMLDNNAVTYMIYQSCENKRIVVEKDPKEQGERALLNFGHTLGHAIEKLSNFAFLHGECVEVGCILAAYISQNKGYMKDCDVQRIINLLSYFECPEIKDYVITDVLETVKSDKKMSQGKVKFILAKGIGNAFITREVEDKDMEIVLEEYKHES